MAPRTKASNAKRAHSPEPDVSDKHLRIDAPANAEEKTSSPGVDESNSIESKALAPELEDGELDTATVAKVIAPQTEVAENVEGSASGNDGDVAPATGNAAGGAGMDGGPAASTTDAAPVLEKQVKIDVFVAKDASANHEVIAPEDRIAAKPHYPKNLAKRFASLVAYKNDDESVYSIRQEPFNLEWSTSNVKQSRLLAPGQVTPVRLWMLGELSWNGLLESDDKWPSRAKVGMLPLREGDLMRARSIVGRYSKSKKLVDVNNIISISAHTDMGSRSRGSSISEAKPFTKIFDGRQLMTPDYTDMNVLRPKDLMKGDVILLEASVGRYWDDSENGRIKDWGSTRAFFHLEAVTLLVNGVDDEPADNTPKVKAAGKKLVIF